MTSFEKRLFYIIRLSPPSPGIYEISVSSRVSLPRPVSASLPQRSDRYRLSPTSISFAAFIPVLAWLILILSLQTRRLFRLA